MANPSLVELVNAALVTIGQTPIVSLENDEAVSSTVVMVKAKIDITKRKLLRMNDWNCARKTIQLNTVNKNLGWKYTYALPADCLRVVQISVDGGETYLDLDEYYNRNAGPKESLFDMDQGYLLCNHDEVFIKYTGDIDAVAFDASLASAFVAQLAADLSYSLPASVSLADYMEKLAKKEIKSAKSINARERNILRPEGEVLGIRGVGIR